MTFPTYSFLLLFLPAAVLLCRGWGSRHAVRNWALLTTGVVFYSYRGFQEMSVLLALTVLTFLGVRTLTRPESPTLRRWGLVVLGVDLLVLLAFKLGATLSPGFGFAMPLGISFFTFNLVSYGLDVNARRTEPAPSLGALASYATFFPTIASGPLLRYGDFEAQRSSPRIDDRLIEIGVISLVVGLGKKVLIADPLGSMIEPLFSDFERLGLRDSWLAVLGYAYQLYFDFSGYTDMAIGAAALVGFRVPQNFDAPYTAVHITDFWQRWHMTMSRWFRDYLFLPMSRALLRRRTSLDDADKVRASCLVFTMIAIGLWHGATWAFLAWGLYHGLLLAGHAQARTIRRFRVPVWAARTLTFVAVLLGWVLLKSPSPGMALRIWEGMLGLCGPGRPFTGLRLNLSVAVCILLLATNLRIESRLLEARRTAWQAWVLAGVLALSLISMGRPSPFLYFQF